MKSWQNFKPTPSCLNNKIIAITGAGAGIGRTMALQFARCGATVILLGRTMEKLESLYDEISDSGYPQGAIIPVDLETADAAEYQQIADSIRTEFGRLDGLLHNAALLGERTPISNYPLKTWEQLMKVNVNAPFALTRYCLPLLQNSTAGSIIYTSSSVGLKGRAYWGAYAVSKAAIENLMQTLADELEDISHIRTNSINPGATRTRMRAEAYPAEDPSTVKSSEELVPLFTFFMADDSIGINGQHISF
jgi:NAD(P)-dependent dehydrogenase (short-subunit alcohol dehydrogenase family)